MSIAILFESHEWSNFALADNVGRLVPEAEVQLYDLEAPVDIGAILANDLIVNRYFPSAQNRGHKRSLVLIEEILNRAKDLKKTILNSYEAHYYDIDKYLTAQVMSSNGLPVPEIYGYFTPNESPDSVELAYPCIIKPNCGGRTSDTHVLHNIDELLMLWPILNPEVKYIAEAYITPQEGFITRVEVIGGRCVQILKKMLVNNGLAAYQLGSEFYPYPQCPAHVQKVALNTLELLNIEMGSLDIIEAVDGSFVIDVNSTSNTSKDCIEAFKFDLIAEMAKYIVHKYRLINEGVES